MAFINLRTREIQIKIVYCGPPQAGKTANLRYLYHKHKNSFPSKLLTVTAGGDRTVFFDFLPFTLTAVNGVDLKVRLYTVPGHDRYEETRKTILKGVDGIVFVADASAMRKTNILSLKNLQSNLAAHGKSLARIPLVFQFNKYDLSEQGALLLPHTTLLNDLNSSYRKPYFVASALKGKNVTATLKKIITMSVDAVEKRYREVGGLDGIEINDLALRVQKRLDEVFPDEDGAADALKGKREGLAYALSQLRGIAGGLQWRVPLKGIQAYAQELSSIQPMVADEKHLLLLVRVQSELCRHMLARRRRISPRALLLLLQGFTTLQRLATDHRLSASRQRDLVARLVTAHLAYKKSLISKQSRPEQPAAAKAPRTGARRHGVPAVTAGRRRALESGLEKKAYYLIPADHVDDLREAFRSGFKALQALIVEKQKGA
jgi:small GTP-binding protein